MRSVTPLDLRLVLLVALLAPLSAARADEACNGLTLISRVPACESHLLDMHGRVIHQWHGAAPAAAFAYMLADGSILRPCVDSTATFSGAFSGGRIQRIFTDDQLVWDFLFSTPEYQQHHDIFPMPTGNVLILAWERKSRLEAARRGWLGAGAELWPDFIVEVQPKGATGGTVVWEWHIWDHLVQDVDPKLPGYGVVADHPGLLDINYRPVGLGQTPDWTHVNSISFNPERDEIVFGSPLTNEIYVIDHGTTSVEAAGHRGGRRGHGGDLLYRWGNPAIYDRGNATNQVFFRNHDAKWIPAGTPGEGDILVFNNGDRPGTSDDYSSVVEITPPRDGEGNYTLDPVSLRYGPESPTWSYESRSDFYGGPQQGGAERLPNGNTLVNTYPDGHVFEVTAGGTRVWDYYEMGGRVGVAWRYFSAYTGVAAMDGDDAAGAPAVTTAHEGGVQLLAPRPNPFRESTSCALVLPEDAEIDLAIFDVRGRRIATLDHGARGAGLHEARWDGRDQEGAAVAPGVYFAWLRAGDDAQSARLAYLPATR